jgi:hypothetical protein
VLLIALAARNPSESVLALCSFTQLLYVGKVLRQFNLIKVVVFNLFGLIRSRVMR